MYLLRGTVFEMIKLIGSFTPGHGRKEERLFRFTHRGIEWTEHGLKIAKMLLEKEK